MQALSSDPTVYYSCDENRTLLGKNKTVTKDQDGSHSEDLLEVRGSVNSSAEAALCTGGICFH